MVTMLKTLAVYFAQRYAAEVLYAALIACLRAVKDSTKTQLDDNAYNRLVADRNEIIDAFKRVTRK